MSFFSELKERNVYRVTTAYIVMAWILAQVASIFLPTFEAPEWMMKVFIFLPVLGFPVVLVMAWAQGMRESQDFYNKSEQASREKHKESDIQCLEQKDNEKQAVINQKSIVVLPFVNMSGDQVLGLFESTALASEMVPYDYQELRTDRKFSTILHTNIENREWFEGAVNKTLENITELDRRLNQELNSL